MARQPLDEWLRCEDFACWPDELALPGMIADGFLGAEAGSPFFARLVEDIHARAPSRTARPTRPSEPCA